MNSTTARRPARADGWIVGPPRQSAPALRLFCLPHAAGAASAYTGWAGRLGDAVEVCPVEPPGRQTRWREPAFDRLGPLVDALATAVAGELDRPYALFGHSMGSLVAFELARELRRRGLGEPRALLVSGGLAPSLRREPPPVHRLPDPELVERLKAIGGLPDEICAEPELLELLLPTVRADFAVCETYAYRAQPPLRCPVTAFAGADDREVPPARMDPWQRETDGGFTRHVLPGGHFFLRSAEADLLALLRTALAPVLAALTTRRAPG